jgi:CubicO group peptidase (beta-lactamase class C family)
VNVFAALGYQGQFIAVIPELDMVVVFTSSIPPEEANVHPALVFDYIVPSVLGEESRLSSASNSVTLIALAIIPVPVIFAGAYYQFQTRTMSSKFDKKEEI